MPDSGHSSDHHCICDGNERIQHTYPIPRDSKSSNSHSNNETPRRVKAFRRFLAADAGQAMVEFALASLFLLTIIFFVIEFGQAVYRYNAVAALAKDAARYASVHGTRG